MNTEAPSAVCVSVVVPVFNEEEALNGFHYEHLMPALEAQHETFEVVYVDDGSADSTLDQLQDISAGDERVRVLALSRNFGKEIATTAGIHASRGEATVIMDGDGQHPPSDLTKFLEKWRAGAQVVVGIRTSNEHEGFVKHWGSKAFYALFNATSETELVPRSTDYRLIDREVRREFLQFRERQRITRALIDWLGFDRAYVEFASPARIAGKASYSTRGLIQLAANSYISLSLKPLYFFGWVGATITALALILGLFVFAEQVALRDPLGLNISGSALLGIFISFLVGIVLMAQAMIAAYVAHVHKQTQGRPLFVINRSRSALE